MDNTNNPEIAATILRQFRRALFMIGASQIVDLGNGIHFSIPTSISARIRKIRITLAADDTYTVEGFTRKALSTGEPTFSHSGVYVDSVLRVIESETGLRTSL